MNKKSSREFLVKDFLFIPHPSSLIPNTKPRQVGRLPGLLLCHREPEWVVRLLLAGMHTEAFVVFPLWSPQQCASSDKVSSQC